MLFKDGLQHIYFKICAVVALYWFTSILTVFVNKALLSGDNELDAPLFITWIQCITSVVLCQLLRLMKKSYLPNPTVFNRNTMKQILPLAILFTMMVGMNNLCLKYVAVSFYYIGRSLTTVFNVIFSFVLLRQGSSFRCLACCATIIFGFWLGVDQESIADSFSMLGTVYGILGSLSLSLYSIYTKKVLPTLNDHVLLMNYYVNVYAVILFIPLMQLNGELVHIIHYKHLFELWFWAALLAGGICGFSIGFVTGLQIKVTSPLTHNISGTAKACAQTVMATMWYNEQKTWLWWISNYIVLLGSSLYVWVKQNEMARAFKQEPLLKNPQHR